MDLRWLASGVFLVGCPSESTGGGGSTSEADMDDEDDGSSGPMESSTSTATPPPTSGEESTSGPVTTSGDMTEESGSGSGTSGAMVTCAPGEKPGAVGATDAWPTSAGVNLNVRTPADYDPTIARPLLVVWSPAGGSADVVEPYTGLTPDAHAAGYIIAYADHVSPMSVEIIEGLAVVLDDLVAEWCIDESRVFYTGHSDGGSISEVLHAVDEDGPRSVAAAPSAAGVTGTTMMNVGCPSEPKPIMIIHSANDGLFPPPEFGVGAADVWASCNGCSTTTVDEGPCVRYPDCDEDVITLYCETSGQHGSWTGLNTQMIEFFEASGASR